MASRRRQVLEAFRTRLQAITIANAFETDCGAVVLLGEQASFGDDDRPQAIRIDVGDEQQEWAQEGLAYQIVLPIGIWAMARADLDEPWIIVEAVFADIKRAIELEDRTLNDLLTFPIERGPTQTFPREPGSAVVGLGITYIAKYKEGWGNP